MSDAAGTWAGKGPLTRLEGGSDLVFVKGDLFCGKEERAAM